MSKVSEINILCVGELTAQKTSFLSFYSQSPSDQAYKVYAHREVLREEGRRFGRDEKKQMVVFLHEVQELQDMEVYLKYPFDAIIFFVQIDQFHNTARNILDTLQLFSMTNGANVYKIPFRVVALSQKCQHYYDDIGRGDKHRLLHELDCILTKDQIIYVEFNCAYKQSLSRFYREIVKDSAAGIKQNTYTNWYFRGIRDFFSCGQIKLSFFKLYGELRFLFLKWRGSWKK